MYMVVSRWEAIPGHEQQVEEVGAKMRGLLRAQPGVVFMEGIEVDGHFTVVHAYADEATYDRITNDPNGAFAKAAAENKLEEHMRWLGSERGVTRE